MRIKCSCNQINFAGTASTYGQYSEPDLTQYFEDRSINGTFVLYDLQSGQHVIHNSERAEKQFIPAPTFKILHSLIALETGVIADTSTVLLWDGEHPGQTAERKNITLEILKELG